jgi:hypothetical protein
MHNAPVIGIHGLARSGKDTVANFIIAARGGYIYSFADPIRAMLVPLGVNMRDPYWQDHKEDVIPAIGKSPRQLMQTLGTEWGRELINADLWLILAKAKLLSFGHGMVIADVRFENEADWVRAQNGRILHVTRPNNIAVAAHASENGIGVHDEDLVLANDGTLEELQDKVKVLIS